MTGVQTCALPIYAGSGPVQWPEYLTYSEGYQYRLCADISITALLSSYAAGDKAMGFSWLRRAFEERNCALLWLGSSPMFDVVRQDAAGAELLKHVGDRGYVPAK